MQKLAFRIIPCIFAVIFIAGCASAPVRPSALTPGDYDYLREYMSWYVKKEMKKSTVTGLSLALVDDQHVVWSDGFGFSNKESGIPAGVDTVYRAGSISKLFTTMAALQLAEQGKLDLDSPLSTYIPGFSLRSRFASAPPITPRSIMTHHSGIPSDRHQGMWSKNPVPISALPSLINDEYVAFPPNTVYSYSNLGMTLLGLAIQNVSTREYAAHMRQNLLEPLGMEQASFAAGVAAIPQAAKAYLDDNEKQEPLLRDIPAGGLNTSVRDMSRFIRMVLAGGSIDGRQIVRKESLREMFRPQNRDVALDGDFSVGLGWMLGGLGSINIAGAGTVAHHGGATFYHRAQLVVLPDVKLGIVVMANSGSAQKVVNDIATEALKLAVEIKTGRKQPEPAPAVSGGLLSERELQEYAGSYATIGGLATLSARSGYLRTSLLETSFRLVPRQDKQLQLQYRLLGIIPIDLGELSRFGIRREVVAGREILRASDGVRDMLIAEKITPVPLSTAWRNRLGTYRIMNSGEDAQVVTDIKLREENGLLLVEYRMTEFGNARVTTVLLPLSDNEAVFAGLWRGMGETVRVVHDSNTEQLLYSGYRLARQEAE